MKKTLIALLLLISQPAFAELAGPWAINTKACQIAKDKMYAADSKDAPRLTRDYDCVCDVRTSDIKPFSNCEKGQLKRLQKAK